MGHLKRELEALQLIEEAKLALRKVYNLYPGAKHLKKDPTPADISEWAIDLHISRAWMDLDEAILEIKGEWEDSYWEEFNRQLKEETTNG